MKKILRTSPCVANLHHRAHTGVSFLTTKIYYSDGKTRVCSPSMDERQPFQRFRISFIPNPDNLKEVNRRNEIKTDNMVSNLEWCDRKYNANYGTGVARQKISRANNPNDRRARLIVGKKNSKRVKQIANNGDILNIFDSMRQASVATGVCLSTVLRHCKGIISFSTLGFSFKYV